MFRFAPLLLLLGATLAQAQPFPAVGVAESASSPSTTATALTDRQAYAAAAVVRVPSHGISATVIWTGQGKSYLLSCAHGHQGADRTKKMAFDFPWPDTPTGPKRAASRVLAIGHPGNDDLTLIELADGPLPFVCPVAPRNHQVGRQVLSVGYDMMKWPQQQAPATVLTAMTYTREVPWHGRSGGALIDGGSLVGVVHGYTWTPGTPRPQQAGAFPNASGMYVSHQTICSFLDRAGFGSLIGAPLPAESPPQALPPSAAPGTDDLRAQLAALQQQLALLQRQLDQMQGGYTPAPPPRTVPQQPQQQPMPPAVPRVSPTLPPCRH